MMMMMMMMIMIIIIIIYDFSESSWKTAGTERYRGTNGKIRNPESCKVTHYRGADKSFARPGRKQGTATTDFDGHINCLLS